MTPVPTLLAIMPIFCGFYMTHATDTNSFNNKDANTFSISPPTVFENNNTVSKDNTVEQRNRLYHEVQTTPCEAGHQCSENHWCTLSERCHHCSELEPRCNETETILVRHTACKQYCYRYQLDKIRSCEANIEQTEARISHLVHSLSDSNSVIENKTREVVMAKEACSKKVARLMQKNGERQVILKSSFEAELNQSHEKTQQCYKDKAAVKKEIGNLQSQRDMFIALSAVMAVLAIVGSIAFCRTKSRLKSASSGRW